jgi:hypothetical protein
MAQGLTDWLQQNRFLVVEVDKGQGRVRVRGAEDRCSELSCQERTLVVTDEGATTDLDTLNPGDIIKVDSSAGRADRLIVVRRAWEEWASPEL